MLLQNRKKIKLKPINIKYHTFKGVKAALKLLLRFKKDEPILVYFDPDIDGLISGYFVCRFLVAHGYKFSWYINENRQHGFLIPLEKLHNINIIAVDFMMTPNEVKRVVDSGSNIISIDHHENTETFIRYKSAEGKEGIVVNNQYPFEEESSRYLSGAGVVFEVLRLFDNDFDTLDNRALVGITLLSDVRDIENINARGYLIDLYTHKYNGYIKYLIDNSIGKDYIFGVPRIDRNYVDYTLSPIINSILRFNRGDIAVKFILGSGTLPRVFWEKQKEFVKRLQALAKVKDFDGIRIIEINCNELTYEENFVVSNFIGLVASNFLEDKSCIAYLRLKDGNIGRASFRGRENGIEYLGTLLDANLLYGKGHPSAFGVLDIDVSDKNLIEIGQSCLTLEVNSEKATGLNKIKVKNLSMFIANGSAEEIATENLFCLSQHQMYIKYTGDNIIKKRGSDKYIEYNVDGISVLCFDKDLNFDNGLIFPILERGLVYFYLNRKEN